MELPRNKVTVSTENQSDLLQETPRPATPWASLRVGGGSSSHCPPSLASSERWRRPHQLLQHRNLAAVPGKTSKNSQFTKQAAENTRLKNPWREIFHSRVTFL